MFKIYNCFSGAFSFASRVIRHPLSKKATLTTYRVLKKIAPILAVAFLEVTFLLVEKSAECANLFVMIMMEVTKTSSHVFLVKEFDSPLDGYIHILSKFKFKEDKFPAIEATCPNISYPMKLTCSPSSMAWHFIMVDIIGS
ncbi:hypothetical protein CU097_013288 [Rhizopus azygosporus]|uniref:Uncharacterized protein n=1 Tax=Rhizopus azygosporus TaxID=86630 RepID=A0A367KCZ1_RHIAZ|nr:hypothetical protein CU097_013288 [Rhizopus azygosporus]